MIRFISNRLPVTVGKQDGEFTYTRSIGGLATGLQTVHEEEESLWIGWSGLPAESLSDDERKEISDTLVKEYRCVPVDLSEDEIDNFYYGFCNEAIWPLFHYFPNRTRFEESQWESYKQVNKKFYDVLAPVINDDDMIWVHDYQLMLLPQMIKENHPNVKIGFFLHIPYPSYEIFRLLPWRLEILEGLMGADLIGFHTYDYVRHFISSVRRLFGYDNNLGYINTGNRLIRADVFPMGIDFDKYLHAPEQPEIQEEIKKIKDNLGGRRMIFSVDRLDYTKGIPERIKGFNYFLEKYPEYKEKISLVLVVAPSRTHVEQYQELKREIEELVSDTNGRHGTIGWTPISFFYRPFPFEQLTALYACADALLVTPLRDGMNLIAKEYIATRGDSGGALILSETAGASHELSEALFINSNDISGIADTIKEALELPLEEQKADNRVMNRRLKRYNIEFWARDFLAKLKEVAEYQYQHMARNLVSDNKQKIIEDYKKADKRLLFLDYDGTLQGFFRNPEDAKPDEEIRSILTKLADDPKNQVVLISGRSKASLKEWFSDFKIDLVAGHGIWMHKDGEEWDQFDHASAEWKTAVRPIMDTFMDRTPGSQVEEKDYALAWHYRKCEPDLADLRCRELKEALYGVTENLNVSILDGKKVLEVKDSTINKGRAAAYWFRNNEYTFVLAAGDDHTDEDMFEVMPASAYSIKVGMDLSRARFHVKSWKEMRNLLKELIN